MEGLPRGLRYRGRLATRRESVSWASRRGMSRPAPASMDASKKGALSAKWRSDGGAVSASKCLRRVAPATVGFGNRNAWLTPVARGLLSNVVEDETLGAPTTAWD